MTVSIRFQIGGHAAADWAQGNPVLLEREFVTETDTGKFKLGDGRAAWKDLPYQPFWSKWGRIEGNITDQKDLGSMATKSAGDYAALDGATFSGQVSSTAGGEAVRIIGTNAFQSFYLSGGTKLVGYIQGSAGGLNIVGSAGYTLTFSGNGGDFNMDGRAVNVAAGSTTFYSANYDRGICYIAAGIVRPVSDNVVAFGAPNQRWTVGYLRNLNLSGLATFASDSAAGSGGLVAGDLYKTAAGALMIKL